MAEQPENPYSRLYGKKATQPSQASSGSQQQLQLQAQNTGISQYSHAVGQPYAASHLPQCASQGGSMTHANGFLASPWHSAEVHNCPAHAQPAQDLQHSAVSRVQGRDGSAGIWSSANLPNSALQLSHACPDSREKLEQDISRASVQVQAQPLAERTVEQSDSQRDSDGGPSSRKRRRLGHADEQKPTVLIWDVDETLVLFLSLLDGSFARAFGMQVLSRHKCLAPIHLVWQNKVHSTCQGLVALLANVLGNNCVTFMKKTRFIHMLVLASGPVAVL